MTEPIHRYTPSSQLREPRRFLRSTGQNILASRGVAWRLFQRDFRSRYRKSVLGYVWVFIPAVATALVWVILTNRGVVDPGPLQTPYPVFVFAGTLLWQGFLDALNSPLRQLGSASQMMTKVNFPTEALLLAGLADVVVNAVIRLVVLIPIFVYYDMALSLTILLVPAGMVSLIAFGWGIGLLAAPFGLLYEDVGRSLLVVTMFLFLVTPIAYTTPPGAPVGTLQRLNPLTSVIDAPRNWLIGAGGWPGTGWWVVSSLSFVMVAVGWLLYRLSVPHLIDRMQS